MIHCTVPFVRAFVLPDGSFRDCCATTPFTIERDKSFVQWWTQDDRLNAFREQLQTGEWPEACASCRIQEQNSGESFRTAMNKANPVVSRPHPREWSISFGNVCNLACWTCTEDFSSTIEAHKRKLNILPEGWTSPNEQFAQRWPDLHDQILASYDHHPTVTLSLLGGEPTYNPIVVNFLLGLVDAGLSRRTRLEITTNGTKSNARLMQVLDRSNWKHICVFVSIDAVGEKAEWLRYGCSWADVDANTRQYATSAHWTQIHTTVSMLNIDDLPAVHDYAQELGVKHVIMPLAQPSYMSLEAFDGHWVSPHLEQYGQRGLLGYVGLVGTRRQPGAAQQLKDYVNKFSNRKPFDKLSILR
jgi:MoaA/NifB/PqqE/SkfB family radical SAM enzyme